ncbi:MAG: glycoside hydrolase family 125 protein [Chitinophagaceae bacterium]|nr:MAG: glycoside hydrolase family 125 protein [Chitinophagaceae bacterium]
MKRRNFLKATGVLGGGLVFNGVNAFELNETFPVVRTPAAKRNFTSTAVEAAIKEFRSKVKDPELGWLFENCFPNTLDTTVTFTTKDGKPDTYVITGDIDAMWLRDSSAQVWPYFAFIKEDPKLKQLIAGVINHQVKCILKDPYANAFYNDPNKKGEWYSDVTKMQPGIHERKWEIDSLCYPIRLAYNYYKLTGDKSPFDAQWLKSVELTLQTFKEQQRKDGDGPYSFQRKTSWATDGVPMNGYGYPVKPVGLICSSFRPSDDATVYSFLVPSNFFAVVSLNQASEMVAAISGKDALSKELKALADEVAAALKEHAVIDHPSYGKIYAYEVNGFGSFNLMDDANVPSLLSLPYLGAIKADDPIYQNTRKMLWSLNNPFFFKGSAGEGIGGPHAGKDMIWPMSITMYGLTSISDEEIRACVKQLRSTHGKTGFMHESFNKNDATKFTRSWFAWSNTLFGEFLWEVYKSKPQLLA